MLKIEYFLARESFNILLVHVKMDFPWMIANQLNLRTCLKKSEVQKSSNIR